MGSIGNIYATLTPVAIVFILIEVLLCWYYKKDLISFEEFIANFGTALGNQTVNVLVAAGVYITYGFLWSHFRLIDHIDMTWYNFLLLLLGVDFIFYWVHRWGHHINIMWAAHSPHHSAEEMNFAVALRASVTQRLFSFFFFWPLTIIGFKPIDIYAMTGLHLFIAFLHHTELIRKLWRWVEFIFTTPSHHRVHHGVNFKYLDKNFSEFLIIWDRIFGTFAEEDEKVVYGMYHPPHSWNPININFHYYRTLWRDAVAAPHVVDKFKLWFMPLGWRPRGLPPLEPIIEVTPANQQKYRTHLMPNARPYLILQLILGVVLMLYVIKPNSDWNTLQRWVGALMLWHTIIDWGGIMESRTWVFLSENIRIIYSTILVIIFSSLTFGSPALYVFLVLALISIGWVWRFFRIPQTA
jgi:sterol desaturase/sphingolipid hydroxylase (fatty acid hydroxylase superfamily)